MLKLTKVVTGFTILCFVISYAAWAVADNSKEDGLPDGIVKKYGIAMSTRKAVSIDRKYSAKFVKKIGIQTISTDVTIVKGTGDQIELTLKGNFPDGGEQSLQTEVTDDTLSVRTVESAKRGDWNLSFNLDDEASGLTIRLPKDVDNITLKTVSGDIEFNDRTLKELSVESTSGDVTLKRADFDKMIFRTVSGDVLCKFCKVRNFEGKTVSGDISIAFLNPDPNVEVKTTSGDTELRFEKNPDVQVTFNTVSGDMKMNAKFGNAEEGNARLGKGKGKLFVKSVSGDFDITDI